MKILLWILLAPIGMIFLGIAGTEINKAYWDRQVTKLCLEEGGAHVHETIQVTLDQINNLGEVGGFVTMASKSARPDAPAYKESFEEIIRSSHPTVLMVKEKVYRASDGAWVGSIVSYIRRGGDFPTGVGHPSSYRCPEISEYYAMQQKFFAIQGDE